MVGGMADGCQEIQQRDSYSSDRILEKRLLGPGGSVVDGCGIALGGDFVFVGVFAGGAVVECAASLLARDSRFQV
jgi:hypothetical protein